MLTTKIKKSIDQSVLCWLATSSSENFPNVSPKEIFTYYTDDFIIIANIASPQTIKNIKENNNVCVSFIDVLVQKGFQINGIAEIIKKSDSNFDKIGEDLLKMTEGKFPFSTIIKIKVEHTKPIIAPKYILYPKTTEKQQIESAMETYKLLNKPNE